MGCHRAVSARHGGNPILKIATQPAIAESPRPLSWSFQQADFMLTSQCPMLCGAEACEDTMGYNDDYREGYNTWGENTKNSDGFRDGQWDRWKKDNPSHRSARIGEKAAAKVAASRRASDIRLPRPLAARHFPAEVAQAVEVPP
jgi:hypothetical protein